MGRFLLVELMRLANLVASGEVVYKETVLRRGTSPKRESDQPLAQLVVTGWNIASVTAGCTWQLT